MASHCVPLCQYTVTNICDTIQNWFLNDVKYRRDQSKIREIFVKHQLSGQKLDQLSTTKIIDLIQQDMLKLMTINTFNITLKHLDELKNKSRDELRSLSAKQIAEILSASPLSQLLGELRCQNMNGSNIKVILTDQTNHIIKQVTGWNDGEIEQIKIILLKNWSFTEKTFINNMNNILSDTSLASITDKIRKVILRFNVEQLHYKIKNNKDISNFSDRIIDLVDDILENNQANENNGLLTRAYSAIARCFVNDNYDEEGYNNWSCSNCGNYNFNRYIGNKMHNNLYVCALCGTSVIESIVAKIRNYDTFIMSNSDSKVQPEENHDELDHMIETATKAANIDLSCPNRNDNIKCATMVRLARTLIQYNECLKKLRVFDIKTTTEIDIAKCIDDTKFASIFVECIKSYEHITANDKDILIKLISDTTDIKSYFLNRKRVPFAKFIQKHINIKTITGAKIYDMINKSLKNMTLKLQFGTFMSTLNMVSVDKDWHHILTAHIHNGSKNNIKNVFRFYNKVVHYNDLPSEVNKCKSVQRKIQRDKNSVSQQTNEEKKDTEKSSVTKTSMNATKHNNLWTLAQLDIQQQLDMMHAYLVHSTWQRMVKHFENQKQSDDYETDLKIDESTNKQQETSESVRAADKFVSEFGFGVKYCHIQLSPIYNSIYDELIHGRKQLLQDIDFHRSLLKAVRKHAIATNKINIKNFLCQYFDIRYNIPRNEPIGIRHILSLILYTDLSYFCTKFRATYRRIGNETETDLTQKHCQLYLYARSLYEAVEFFGRLFTENSTVHHGLGRILYFEKFAAQFWQPISTTTRFSKAQEFSAGVGIILSLRSLEHSCGHSSQIPKCLPVSWLSNFPYEDEILFYGSSIQLQITDITEAETLRSHSSELTMFNKFQQTIQDSAVIWNNNAMVRGLQSLIQMQQHENHLDEQSKYITKYGQGLFKYFCRHPNTTNISLKFESLPDTIKKVLFINKISETFSIISTLNVFPYLKEITFTEMSVNNMINQFNDYINAIREYINTVDSMDGVFLKQLSIISIEQKDNDNNMELKNLQQKKSKLIIEHKWDIMYKNEKNIHQLLFINNDNEKEQKTRQLQLKQQQAEKKEIELQQQRERERQLKKTKQWLGKDGIHMNDTNTSNQQYDSKIQQICDQLSAYYKTLGREYNSLFSTFCDENGFDDDILLDELNTDVQDCMLIDFDEQFPFPRPPANEKERKNKIFNLIKTCYNNPNKTFNEGAAVMPQFDKKFYDITNAEIQEVRDLYQKQCPVIYASGMKQDQVLLRVLALGRRHDVDYFLHIVSDYFRARVDSGSDTFNDNGWIHNHKHFQGINKMNAKQIQSTKFDPKEIMQGAIKSFQARVCPRLIFNPTIQINGSLKDTIKYIIAGVDCIDGIIKQRTMDTMPFQMDLCIGYGKPFTKFHTDQKRQYDDDDDDDDIDEFKLESNDIADESKQLNIDFIGNIEAKLKKNNLKYQHKKVLRSVQQVPSRTLRRTYNDFVSKLDENEKRTYPKNSRFIMFVDRRDMKSDSLYVYNAPKNCGKIPSNEIAQLWYINASKTCLLPNMDYENKEEIKTQNLEDTNITSDFHCRGSLLTLSFHVKTKDAVSCYLHWNGQICRFMPKDIIMVLPKLFNMDWNDDGEKEESSLQELIKQMEPKIRDKYFDGFVQSYRFN